MAPWPEQSMREDLAQSPSSLCLDCSVRRPANRYGRCEPCTVAIVRRGQDFCWECNVAVVPRGTIACDPCAAKVKERVPDFSVCACGRSFIGERGECLQCWGEYAAEDL